MNEHGYSKKQWWWRKCYDGFDYYSEMKKEHEIPDEQTSIIENEWYDCPECLFRDRLFGIDGID